MSTKLYIYKAVLLILTYDSESWIMLDRHAWRITGAEMRYLHRSVGKTRWERIRNEKIREQLEESDVKSPWKASGLVVWPCLSHEQTTRTWESYGSSPEGEDTLRPSQNLLGRIYSKDLRKTRENPHTNEAVQGPRGLVAMDWGSSTLEMANRDRKKKKKIYIYLYIPTKSKTS